MVRGCRAGRHGRAPVCFCGVQPGARPLGHRRGRATQLGEFGQLDPNQLFYLLSRGLDRETARTLLTFAFADTVLSRLQQPAIRAYAERAIAARLPGSDTLLELV